MKQAKQRAQWDRDNVVVYHYTDFAGLLGIVENRELWLTDSRFQNDAKEIRSFLEVAQGVLARRTNFPTHKDKPFSEVLSPAWEHWLFTCSFSKARSQLSQWRAYCRQGGVAIGFCRKQLGNLVQGSGVELLDCVYDSLEQQALVIEFLNKAVSSPAYLRLQENPNNSAPDIGALRQEALMLAAQAKLQEYHEEREVRLIKYADRLDDVDFRTRGQKLVPFFRLKLDSDPVRPSTNRLGISEIVIWPGENRIMEATSMLASKYKLGCLISNALSAHRTEQ